MKDIKVTAIIQAHMSSTRLPNKIMLDLCHEPELFRMIERVKQSKRIDRIVVATSDLPCDDIIAASCLSWGVCVSRGSDTDVLSRYWKAAQEFPSPVYMRLTSDSPLIDPGYLDMCVDFFLSHHYHFIGLRRRFKEQKNTVCLNSVFVQSLIFNRKFWQKEKILRF